MLCDRRTGEFYIVVTESDKEDDYDSEDDNDDMALLEDASRLAHSV